MSSPARALRWQNVPATRLLSDTALQAHWDRLNASGLDLPFMSATQAGAALEAFGTGRERLLCAADAQGQTRAMFLMTPDGALKWRSFQPSQLPLGPWVSDASIRLPELVRGLQRHLPIPSLAVTVSQIDPRAEPRAETREDDVESVDYIQTSWIELTGDFAGYWEARGKNLKQNLRKRRKKLGEEGKALSLRILTEHQDMAEAVRLYGQLESSGWKAQQGTAIHADNEQGRYYTRALEAAASRGEARVYEYWIDGKCAAIDLCLVRNDLIVVLKTSYDEEFKDYSPAFLLREEQVQHLYAEGKIRRVEFYGRFMEWHSRWTEQTRTLYHLTVYRWGWVAKLAAAVRHWRAPQPTAVQAPAEAAT